jgi:hypothetical protein
MKTNDSDFLNGEVSKDGNPLETHNADAESEVKDYRTRILRGEIFYVCLTCGRQYDNEDKIIAHVSGHYPTLVKEEENGK